MRAIIHLDRAKEDSELGIRLHFLAKFSDDELKSIDPFISQVQILNQDPVSSLLCLLNRIFNCLIQALSDLEVLQFGRLV